ncbi:hypothetical protein ACFL3B_02530 [Gemmatimonadota bacterium]
MNAIHAALGVDWTKTHAVVVTTMPSGEDINSLHQAGQLAQVQWREASL